MSCRLSCTDIGYHAGLWAYALMKTLSFLTTVLLLTAGTTHAACYADYKAKQDDPLRLHYGIAEVRGDCSVSEAQRQIADRLARDGWQLLNVLGVFDDAGLEERKDSAGEYFLRY